MDKIEIPLSFENRILKNRDLPKQIAYSVLKEHLLEGDHKIKLLKITYEE